ncbi:hypothetical protein LOZ53_003361 [Ophidiomyces ophidiicola]|nr:hypothetical protein LOZ55_003252 [Ophidiomyces ophidiicola]KAI1979331.1 hypothetical protein LOZ54_006108 [Ophidiomyces ophidiicola]KAI1990108.1 hypothetical protein LOZ53_003361 [Ophidiomyces ophidiicola]KAI1993631.1 hypothetical protein LOZ51_004010 [Ophidiomyces ophidiicola]
MANPPAQYSTTIIDSVESLLAFVDCLDSLPTLPPSIYIDLEGVNLGRHGSISIISVFLRPKNEIYLIDMFRLGDIAFSTPNIEGTTLRAILQSPAHPKVFFDVRNDSDALFSHYGISLDGFCDLQLMELATRKGSKDFVAGLSRCIERHSTASEATKVKWRSVKQAVIRLYDPKQGGQYEIFNERPMKPEIIEYCANDVALLPGLYDVYAPKLHMPGQEFWQDRVILETRERINLSQQPGYDGHAESKVRGPWSSDDSE